jgi:hypothetical protein
MDIQSDRAAIIDERDRLVVATSPVTPDDAFAPPPPPAAAVIQPVVGSETVLTSRSSGFTPGALVAGIAAIALLIIGGITAARAGIDSTLDQPVVEVGGYTATALLGLLELALGLVLLTAAIARARSAILFLGITGGVMALVAVFQPSVGEGSLAIERNFAIAAAIVMGVVVAASLLPTVRRNSVVQRIDTV